jgi:hypothetical protein
VLVTIVRGGGLAGLVRRAELDSAVLPPDAVAELAELVERLPRASRPAGRAGPDEFRYELTVVDTDVTWQVRTTESALSDEERLLIAFVDDHAGPSGR